ncbi:MAG: VCBS repeat-containing protein, partial [Rhodocyclaceae bacterium]|nr:VCBS repeat-containing protein [Rhodocyclaceae bacterium]
TQGLGRFSEGRLRLLFGDMDGDGDLEAQFFKDGTLAWVGFNPGWGDFASPQNPNLPVEQRGHTPISFVNAQALIQASTEAATAVGLAEASAGAPTTAQLRAIAASTPGVSVHPWTQFRSGDLNGNGQLDVVIAQAGANTVQVRFDDSGWLAPQQTNFWNADFNRGWKVDWDYNFDGRTDLLYSGRLQDLEETWNEPSYATINGKRFYDNDTRFLALSRGDGSFGRLGDGRGLDTWRIGRDDNNDGVVRSGEYGFEGLTLLRGPHDVNGDGRTDVLFRMTDNSVGVWLTRADGGFQYVSWWRHASGDINASLTPSLGKALRADATGDGIADSIWIAGDGKAYVAAGLWNGTFGEIVTSQTRTGWPFGAAADSFSFVDFNLDGRLDLLSGAYGWGTLHLGRADGTFAPELLLWRPDNANYRWWESQDNLRRLAGADLNGDGRADAVHFDNGRYNVWLQQANGTFAGALSGGWDANAANWKARGTFSVAQLAGEAFRGDVNGDGIADAVWRDGWNRFWVARGRSGGGFETAAVTEHSHFGRFDNVWVDYRDLNLDGRLDVVMTSTDSLYSAIAFGQSDGTLGFTASTTVWTLTEGVNRHWWESQDNLRRLAGADLNGDGRADALLFDNGHYNVWLQQANGTFAGALSGGWDANTPKLTAEQVFGQRFSLDLDGDGYADKLWRTARNGFLVSWGIGGDRFSDPISLAHGRSADLAAYTDLEISFGDVDGDGDSDLLWSSRSTGEAWLQRAGSNLRTAGYTSIVSLGSSGASRQADLSDLNGDGRADLVRVTRANPTAGGTGNITQITAAFGRNDGSFGATITSATISGAPLIGQSFSGDINGDGRADTVFRDPLNRVWITLGTTTGATDPTLYTTLLPSAAALPSGSGDPFANGVFA